VPYKHLSGRQQYEHLSGRQQYDVDSLPWVAEECNEEVVQSVTHGSHGVVFRLRRNSYGVGRLSGIAYPRNWRKFLY
jgi:hypothetical protein